MIISASRRTDIPGFYFEWFLNRLKAGEVLVRNPMNHRQISRVQLSTEAVDGIVFWTKNPAPMLARLKELAPYPYYVQFTINPYGPDLEAGLPDKAELLETFWRLADELGPERVLWRYSPVLTNARYTESFHLESFGKLAHALQGYTRQCKLSFLDLYPKIRKSMAACGVSSPAAFESAGLSGGRKTEKQGGKDQAAASAAGLAAQKGVSGGATPDKLRLALEFLRLAETNGISLGACGEPDLNASGIPPAACIDGRLMQRIREGFPALAGKPALSLKKDAGQRPECSCTQSADIGSYDTCLHGCRYCYANRSVAAAQAGFGAHDPVSAMLCGRPGPLDKIVERKSKPVKSPAGTQFRLG